MDYIDCQFVYVQYTKKSQMTTKLMTTIKDKLYELYEWSICIIQKKTQMIAELTVAIAGRWWNQRRAHTD